MNFTQICRCLNLFKEMKTMVKRIHIKESVNIMPDLVYDNLALLGYCCTLAANDLHHVHLCAEGDKFQEIHEDAEVYMGQVRELGDTCLELAKEGGLELYNETVAHEVIKDSGNDWKVEEGKSYDFKSAYTAMSNILSDLTQFITLITDMEGVTSDVVSVLDDYARNFGKSVNYFIAKKLSDEESVLNGQVESMQKISNKTLKESNSYKDSDAWKSVTDYGYIVNLRKESNGSYKLVIKFNDGSPYTYFILVPPTDDELADYIDEWLVKDEHNHILNDRFDYYPTNLDGAVVCALQQFWGSY